MTQPDPLFSVITVTHNRRQLLPRVYASLVKQTFKEFEWVIVDDGSCDDTAKLVAQWQAANSIQITFYRQENQGWHVGYNRAVSRSRGRFITILDSDDWYFPEALESFQTWWAAMPSDQHQRYFSVSGLCVTNSGNLVGRKFPRDGLESDHLEMRLRWRIHGDKAICIRSEAARDYLYPECLGQFVTISFAWNRAALTLKSRFFNKAIKCIEYQPDGLSASTIATRANSPLASYTYYAELLDCGRKMRWADRIKTRANAVRYRMHMRSRNIDTPENLKLPKSNYVDLFIGLLVFLRDRFVLLSAKI